MSAVVHARVQHGLCEPKQCVKGDPQHTPQPFQIHSAFINTTHGVLTVRDSTEVDSTTSGPLHVKVYNGSDGTNTDLKLRSTVTVGELKQKFLRKKPQFGDSLNLVYNGKPVLDQQTLSELHVKQGAMFLIFHKCHGG